MAITDIIILISGLSLYTTVIWAAWKVVHHK